MSLQTLTNIFPAPLPDETLCSVLVRTGRMNGFADFRDMASRYFGHGAHSSFIDAEIDLSMLSNQSNFASFDAKEVLERHTWCGVQVRLGELDRQRFEAMASGRVRPTLGSLTFSDSAVLGFCPSCREHDLRQYGMSYWHRLHQLPIVFFCPHHGDKVVRVRIKRCQLHKAFPVPGDFESDLNSSEPMFSMNENFWRGVAVMTAKTLQTKELPDADMMHSVMAEELRRRGFLPPLTGVRLTALTEQLAHQAFENSLGRYSTESLIFLRRITRSFDGLAAGMILGRIVLLYWLFGGWKAVQERCRWLSVFGSEIELSTRKHATTRSKLEALYRRACSTYIREHPECTRLDFLRAEYRSFRWLLQNDKTWLDRQLPIPHRAGKQLVLF